MANWEDQDHAVSAATQCCQQAPRIHASTHVGAVGAHFARADACVSDTCRLRNALAKMAAVGQSTKVYPDQLIRISLSPKKATVMPPCSLYGTTYCIRRNLHQHRAVRDWARGLLLLVTWDDV